MTGIATAETQPSEAGNFYVYLDSDNDITNGYVKRIVTTYTLPFNPTDFEIDTSDVPDGSYYLSAAIDFGAGNMDPDDPTRWEKRGWGGSSTYQPGSSPSVSDLDGDYNITMHGIP